MGILRALVIAAVLVTGLGSGAAPSQARMPVTGLRLVWADEFNAPAGTRPDPNRWLVEQVDQGNEQQTYVDDRRTSAHDGQGHMVLTAIREMSRTGQPYISGRLSNGFSATPRFMTYGRWEARMLIPAGQGVWPAFWTLGDWAAVQHWPRVGEIDIMESINWAAETHGGVHTTAAGDDSTHRSFGGSRAGAYAGAWHVWRIDWKPGQIVWSVDGVVWQTVTRVQVEAAGARWKFDGERPQAPILNLAVGGDWAGPASGWDRKQFKIDYVRIYREG